MALKPTPRRRGAVAFLGLAVAVTGLSTPAWAVPDATQVVISEVYGGGGNSGAQFTHDFIELYNPTDRDVVLDGHVLEYFSASGGSGGTVTLSGTIKAKGFFLVRAAQGTGGTAGLPTTDVTSTVAMSGSNGSVELRNGTTVLDLVGYGTAIRNETKAAPGLSSTTSAQRDAAGKDTDDNSADFVAAAPTPTNSAGQTQAPTDPDPDPGTTEPVAATIAEIQGTGTASPLTGQKVVTTGVVTAAYATGGFDGFYVQTPGEDRTPDASDGLFVYSKGFDAEKIVPGASVRVTGTAGEFNGLTQVTAVPADVTVLAESLGTVQPKTSVPGTDCALPGTDCADAAAIDAAREKVEGEALALTGDFTVTDVYDGSAYSGGTGSSANFGEVGLAAASKLPLITPTDVVDPHDAAAVKARTAYNDAHRVILDDGSTMNYSTAANTGTPVPWHTADHHVRVGAAVTFPETVILDQRFGWKLQPASRVVGAPSAA